MKFIRVVWHLRNENYLLENKILYVTVLETQLQDIIINLRKNLCRATLSCKYYFLLQLFYLSNENKYRVITGRFLIKIIRHVF